MKTATNRESGVKRNWSVVALVSVLSYLWFRLVACLWPEWTTNPQYSYGFLVPLLCFGLLARSWLERSGRTVPAGSARPHSRNALPVFVLLGLVYLPTRLIEAAIPEWRPVQWLLGIETTGLTLVLVVLAFGRRRVQFVFFPVLFFLVSIPWPTVIEAPVIQSLTRISAAIVIEVMGWLGVPALAHGNVIEVGTGLVDIDQACSGIRSFQSSLMISLFLGELYGLAVWRRVLLVPIGFFFSVLFNVARMSFLTVLASREGVSAIGRFHDQAGLLITVLCTFALWCVVLLLAPRSTKANVALAGGIIGSPPPPGAPGALAPGDMKVPRPDSWRWLWILAVWLLLVEVGVQQWYRRLELKIPPGPVWTVEFPAESDGFREIHFDSATEDLLRFDHGEQAGWRENDGLQWQAFFFEWNPGRVAGYLAKRHTPEICLPATGRRLVAGPKLTLATIHGIVLPIRRYVFETADGPLNVFHCRWESGVSPDSYVEHESTRFNLIRGVWAGRGNRGQKIIEYIVSGLADPEEAYQHLLVELEKAIKVQQTAPAASGMLRVGK
jgi:exosortase